MKLIIGLGNPGKKYEGTKHNIGFITIDELAHQLGITLNKSKFESTYGEAQIGTEKVILIKPQTFMNNSGRSVRPWLDYYDLSTDDVLVIYDDLDLPVGKVRLREAGGSGGHNGIKSIINYLSSKTFNRIKIGIGRPYAEQTVISHVMSTFPKETHDDMLVAVRSAVDATRFWAEGHPFPETMSKFN